MKVLIPSPLHRYTSGRSVVVAEGRSVAELLADLDDRYPGIRFRMIDEQDEIRPHIKIFVNAERCAMLSQPLEPNDEVQIVAALSGG